MQHKQQTAHRPSPSVVLNHNTATTARRTNLGTVKTLCMRSLNDKKNDGPAMSLYNKLKEFYSFASEDEPVKNFEDLTYDDIIQENVIFILSMHAQRIKNMGRIPHGWYNQHGFDQPDKKPLSPDSIDNLFSPLFSILKSAFPEHPLLQVSGNEWPGWWKELKGNLRTCMEKQRTKGEGEEFDPKTSCLYIVNANNPILRRYKHGEGVMDVLDKVDLLTITKTI